MNFKSITLATLGTLSIAMPSLAEFYNVRNLREYTAYNTNSVENLRVANVNDGKTALTLTVTPISCSRDKNYYGFISVKFYPHTGEELEMVWRANDDEIRSSGSTFWVSEVYSVVSSTRGTYKINDNLSCISNDWPINLGR